MENLENWKLKTRNWKIRKINEKRKTKIKSSAIFPDRIKAMKENTV